MHPEFGRRQFLATMGAAGIVGALPSGAASLDGHAIAQELAPAGYTEPAGARPKVRFAVIGLDHAHIYGMTAAILRGGGELVSVYSNLPENLAAFQKAFPQARAAVSEEAILDDKSIQLVLSAGINCLRAPLGVRVLRAGKDFLSDKPAVTNLDQLAAVRKAVAETGRIFAVLYSERLEVKAAIHAGYLVEQGAIGKVIQTINIAPHQIQQAGAPARPDWFWDDRKFGGILCDIGSHQAEQFLYFTGSTRAEVVASQVANWRHPEHPRYQDFGDMMLTGNGGAGYVRVDWFTPDGLGVWGDGRLFILGTDGYIELRKYIDITGRPGGNHLFLVDKKGARHIDCNPVVLPFGPQFVRDVAERTRTAQDQAHALLTAELVIRAQAGARILHPDK